MRKHLQDQLEEHGYNLEWKDIVHDVNEISEIEVKQQNVNFIIRTETKCVAGRVFKAAGVSLPPVIREGKTVHYTQAAPVSA